MSAYNRSRLRATAPTRSGPSDSPGSLLSASPGSRSLYVVEGTDVTDNPWVSFFAAVLLLVALLMAMPAFGMAVTAKVQHETWAGPVAAPVVFPALVVFVVYGQSHLWN